mgnify:CR=1 FL=1
MMVNPVNNSIYIFCTDYIHPLSLFRLFGLQCTDSAIPKLMYDHSRWACFIEWSLSSQYGGELGGVGQESKFHAHLLGPFNVPVIKPCEFDQN